MCVGVMEARGARCVVSAAAVVALAGQALGQVDRTWVDATSGVFSDGSRWSPSGTPGASDNVFISATGATYGVSLDGQAQVNNFELDSADATFNVQTFGFGTSGHFFLSNGTTQGAGIGQGAVIVSGQAALTNALMQDMDTFASLGDTNVTSSTVQNMELFSVGPQATLTLAGASFQGVTELVVESSLVIDTSGGLNSTFDDTCVDSRGTTELVGNGSMGMGNGSEFNNGGLFSTDGNSDNQIVATGETSAMFKNMGTFVKSALITGAPIGRGGQPTTTIGEGINW